MIIKLSYDPTGNEVAKIIEFCKQNKFEFGTIQLWGVSVGKTNIVDEKYLFTKEELKELNYAVTINGIVFNYGKHIAKFINGKLYKTQNALGTGFVFHNMQHAMMFKLKYPGDLK